MVIKLLGYKVNGNGTGKGKGNGNGNGNEGTNTDGWGGERRSDKDEEAYNQKKQFLKTELNKYEDCAEEAKRRLRVLRTQKSQKVITEDAYNEQKHHYEQLLLRDQT